MKAEYIDHMGDDLRVVNAARVSFDKESEWGVVGYENEVDVDFRSITTHPVLSLKEKDKKLISYLATHGHWTPFSHAMITVRETVPIFVARQRFKHMVGFTYNEVSRRYVDDEPEFYFPEEWRSRPEKSIKQGSADPIEAERFEWVQEDYSRHMMNCKFMYEGLLDMGVAPEQARMVLPQSMYTSFYVTGSLAAFARAYKQRIDSHAQAEIQELAKQWDAILRPLFPVSWAALTE